MSTLAEEIEAQLTRLLDTLAGQAGATDTAERGLAWGADAEHARIVVPLALVARMAASTAERRLQEERQAGRRAGWSEGFIAPRSNLD